MPPPTLQDDAAAHPPSRRPAADAPSSRPAARARPTLPLTAPPTFLPPPTGSSCRRPSSCPKLESFVDGMDSLYAKLTNLLTKLQTANEESKAVTEASAIKAIKQQMEKDIDEVGNIARLTKAKFDELEKDNLSNRKKPGCGKGSAVDRSREQTIGAVKKKLKGQMDEFQVLRESIRQEYREVVERRVLTVTGNCPDEETIDDLVETGRSEKFLKDAVQQQGRGQISDIVVEILERHDAVRDLERKLLELEQILATDGERGEDPMVDLLDREVEHDIVLQALPSLFSVEVSLRHYLREEVNRKDAEKNYKSLSVPVKREEKIKPLDDAIKINQKHRMSTGFSIARNGNSLRILTCAHTLADVYTARKHSILTREMVNSVFRFDVQCVHQEHEVLTTPSNLMPSKRVRYPTPAEVIAVDSALDLLVLETDVRDIWIGENNSVCGSEHPPIHLAQSNPTKSHKIVLVGWPPQRSSAVAVGQVSHSDWSYDAVTSLNVKGYQMKLLEVHGMSGGNGFSGGPCLSTNCRCVGVYHGVFNGNMGYAVSLHDVNTFLEKNEILTRWDNEED